MSNGEEITNGGIPALRPHVVESSNKVECPAGRGVWWYFKCNCELLAGLDRDPRRSRGSVSEVSESDSEYEVTTNEQVHTPPYNSSISHKVTHLFLYLTYEHVASISLSQLTLTYPWPSLA
jgi:hypothetical protein